MRGIYKDILCCGIQEAMCITVALAGRPELGHLAETICYSSDPWLSDLEKTPLD